VRPYDVAELARLAALGLSPETDPAVAVDVSPETDPAVAVDGPGPILFLQKVSEKKVAPNRVHLDLVGGPRDEEVARLRALGARVREEHDTYTTMLDPEGNEFCVRDPG
jgi:hypothetical protein